MMKGIKYFCSFMLCLVLLVSVFATPISISAKDVGGYVITKTALYTNPSYKKICTVNKGESFKYLSTTGSFYYVQMTSTSHRNLKGYIDAGCVQVFRN